MPRQVLLFSGASAVGKDFCSEKPAPAAGPRRHGALRVQDRLSENRGRGCLSKPGASLCHRFERGYLP